MPGHRRRSWALTRGPASQFLLLQCRRRRPARAKRG